MSRIDNGIASDPVQLSIVMSPPLVSICIPAYNGETFITETLASVQAQTFTDWEVIVTEDGSKDRTELLVKEFAKTVSQPVIYNRHEINQGLPRTRNTGITTARGAWIALLDSDDLWQHDHLEALVAKARTGDDDLVFAGSSLFDSESKKIIGLRVPTEAHLRTLPLSLFMGWLSVMPSAVLIRHSAFERYGLVSVEYPYVNDTEYWLRVLQSGGRIGYSGKTSCLYRQHAGGISRRATEMNEESARLCEKYAAWSAIPARYKRSRPAALYRWASNAALHENPARAMQLMKKSLRADPLNMRSVFKIARIAALYLSRLRKTVA